VTAVAPELLADGTSPEPTATESTGTAGSGRGGRGHLPYFPALDGLRGVAVAAVLLFHGGFTWMTGGFLGVSTFFTLSGFLITSLLLAERGATAQIDMRQFWRRRFRRLMPAALAALALAVLYTVVAGDPTVKRNIAGDVLSCLAYVANWRFIFSDQSYADLFGSPSPVLHFWSLAIEEQFYLLFPLLGFAVLQYYRKSRQWFGGLLVALLVASLFCTLYLGLSNDAIYYGTETRAAELLAGALLAVVLYHRRVTSRLANDVRARNAVAAGGAAALAACVALWVLTTAQTEWLYRGGFTLYAGLSVLVILAALVPGGPVRVLLAAAPLRQLGRISYGVYLYHWPIFLWISEERTGLTSGGGLVVLFVIRMAVTLALAVLSFRFLEEPVRRGERLLHIRPIRIAPYAIGILAVLVVAISLTAPKPVIDFDTAAKQFEAISTNAPPPPPPMNVALPDPPRPRIAMFGDSTALMTGLGLNDWAKASNQADLVDGAAWLGCGIGRGGERRSGKENGRIPEECNHWERTWAQKLRDNAPNVAVVQIGPWEVADRKLEGDTVWRAPGDPIYDAYILKEMDLAVDTLAATGATVLWLTSPPVGAGKGQDAQLIRGQAAEPARMARLNELIHQLPTERPGKVHIVDLAAWLSSTGEDERLRPDGVHFGQPESKEVSERFLGAAIVDAFKADFKQRHELDRDIAAHAGGTAPTGGGSPSSVPGPSTTPGTSGPAAGPGPEPSTTKYLGPKRKLMVIGDASAQRISDALNAWGAKTGAIEAVASVEDCGIIATTARLDKGTKEDTPAECKDVVFGWLQAMVTVKPDMVVVVPSIWDLTDNQLKGDSTMRGFGDPVYDDAARKQYSALVDATKKVNAPIMWLNSPTIAWGRTDQPPPTTPYPASDPVRVQRYNDILLELRGFTPFSQRIDFAKYAARQPGGDLDPAFRPDGLEVSDEALPAAAEWLGNELLVMYDEFQASE
jgi:peptidoglycan/LPS O-acetylase OafA/YrhL